MKKLKFQAILAINTKDEMKSKILNERAAEMVFDVYMQPSEFAEIVKEKSGKVITITIE
jgi:hypothetical protein